jgi:hypothetical protein
MVERGLKSWTPYLGLIVAGAAAFSMSTMFSSMKPVLLTRFVEQAGYSSSLAGLAVAMPFVGVACASFLMHVFIHRLSLRRAVTVFGAALVLLELLNSLVFMLPAVVLASQFLTGVCVGALMGFTSRAIARTDKPDQIFGVVDMIGVLLMSFMIAGLGWAVEVRGLAGGLWGAVALSLLFTALMFADRGAATAGSTDTAPRARLQLGLRPILVIATGVLFVTFSGLGFTFMFTVAVDLGLGYDRAGSLIGIILFFSAFACPLGGWVSARFGPVRPLMVAFLACALGWFFAINAPSAGVFLAALIPAVCALQLSFPVLLALAGSLDADGEWAAIAAPLITSGFAWAAIAAGLIVDAWSIPALAVATAVGMAACAALLAAGAMLPLREPAPTLAAE